LEVAAMNSSPSGLSNVVQRIVSPRPPSRHAESHFKPFLSIAVEAARALVPGVVDRIGDAAIGLERLFGATIANAACEFGRRDAEIAFEYPLEMVRRITDLRREICEARRLFGSLDQPHRSGDGVPIPSDLIRLAAQARPKSRRPSFVGRSIEDDMLAFRPPCRAARLAVDAGRLHGPDHTSVPGAVAPHEGRPGSLRIEAGNGGHRLGSTPRQLLCKSGHVTSFRCTA
jgi:hypothetical protein